MCGRFASTQTDADLVRAFRAEEVVGEQLAPSYNVAPTLTDSERVRELLDSVPASAPGPDAEHKWSWPVPGSPAHHA